MVVNKTQFIGEKPINSDMTLRFEQNLKWWELKKHTTENDCNYEHFVKRHQTI